MEEVRVTRARLVGAVETDDVVVLIFDPDAADEAGLAGVLLGRDGEDQAAHVAQKFAVRVAEVVMLAVKAGEVGIDHPGEAQGAVLDFVEPLETA